MPVTLNGPKIVNGKFQYSIAPAKNMKRDPDTNALLMMLGLSINGVYYQPFFSKAKLGTYNSYDLETTLTFDNEADAKQFELWVSNLQKGVEPIISPEIKKTFKGPVIESPEINSALKRLTKPGAILLAKAPTATSAGPAASTLRPVALPTSTAPVRHSQRELRQLAAARRPPAPAKAPPPPAAPAATTAGAKKHPPPPGRPAPLLADNVRADAAAARIARRTPQPASTQPSGSTHTEAGVQRFHDFLDPYAPFPGDPPNTPAPPTKPNNIRRR